MKILVAEDDRMYQLLLSKVLAQWGYSPIMAWDGEKAWETLNSPSGPQLAIVDWVMPGTDGMEICRRVRGAKLPHYVYVVLLTSKTDEGDLLAGLEAGADDYLPKPVNLHQLKLRLRAAARVLEAEKGHRMIAEIASDGIVTMGGAGTIQFANSSAGAIFGYPANELIGKPFSSLVPDFAEPARLADVAPALAPARSWAAVELSGRHQSGRQIPLEVSLAEFSEGAQEPLVTAVIRDVTERKARDCQLAHIQKLESIGQLAAGVAHEINTPIQYIGDNLRFIQGAFRGMAQVLDAARGSGEPVDIDRLAQSLDLNYLVTETPQAIQQAIEGAERVTEIVKALKEFSHPGSFQTAPVDLNHLLENAVLISRNKWKHVADLRTELDANLPPVRCLAGELSQVFLNLIVNAADAIASAQQEDPERKGELLVTTRRNGQFVEVRVRDNGTGIPREVRTRVFDPFFTTKPVGSGTGQGLAIAYTIVARKHRGSIEFETEVGAGTTFIVTLPIDGPEIQGAEILENRDAARPYLATNLKSEIAISSLP